MLVFIVPIDLDRKQSDSKASFEQNNFGKYFTTHVCAAYSLHTAVIIMHGEYLCILSIIIRYWQI